MTDTEARIEAADVNTCRHCGERIWLDTSGIADTWRHEYSGYEMCSYEYAEPIEDHRTEAGSPNCATCDGGGCPDCTDPA